MSNDLISRSALKKAINTYDKFACLPNGKLEPIRNLEHPEMFEEYVHFRDIIKCIDNTPTVDTYTEDDVQYAIKEGHQVGYEMAKAKFERPKGKWIKDGEFYRCSECSSQELYPENFCYCCGADMQVKNELNNELNELNNERPQGEKRMFNPYDHRGITEI